MSGTKLQKHEFIRSLGFEDDPFRYYNADQEDRLDKYFIDPPYFESLWGDPNSPESHVVLAPRGGGKSAQRRMLEERCWAHEVFLITYDYFFTTGGIKSAKDADMAFHLRNLNRLALISFFSYLANRDIFDPIMYESEEKRFLTKMIDKYLGDIEVSTIRDVIQGSMTFPAKFKRWWNENLPFIGLLSAFVKSRFQLDFGTPGKFEREVVVSEDPLNHFKTILRLARKFGLNSCYILIDKVDETELTGNDPIASYALVQSLIRVC